MKIFFIFYLKLSILNHDNFFFLMDIKPELDKQIL